MRREAIDQPQRGGTNTFLRVYKRLEKGLRWVFTALLVCVLSGAIGLVIWSLFFQK